MNKKELLNALNSRKGPPINMQDLINRLLIQTTNGTMHWTYSEAKGVRTLLNNESINIYNASSGNLEDYIIEIYDRDEDGEDEALLEFKCFSEDDPLIDEVKSIYDQAKNYAHDQLMKRMIEGIEQ
jgi:hypothetical protein